MCGVGASAGGLAALRTFVRSLARGAGISVVVVQHAAPEQPPLLMGLLARETELDVVLAEEAADLRPERIYVVPPGTVATVERGALRVAAQERAGAPTTIDRLFRSLALDQRERAAAVVLSGAGSDGAAGAREVAARGGLVLAHDPTEAEHAGMPRAAIETGEVHRVGAPDELARAVIDFALFARQGIREVAWPGGALSEELRAQLDGVLELIRSRSGQDFSGYKRTTLLRRVQRRMGLTGERALELYLARLRRDPAEVGALARDLMIGVTSFFRVPEAWSYLAQDVLPRLFAERAPGEVVRAWVPGCATGEEAFTLAMLLAEQSGPPGARAEFQLFASDVDRDALEVARLGRYPAGAVEGAVTPERIERFFQRDPGGYSIRLELREQIVFAPHDLVRDPPFSRLDLVSCRNLLIYLEPRAQRRALELFHFGLRAGGVLALGSAETVPDVQGALFEPVSPRWRVYRRRRGRSPSRLATSFVSALPPPPPPASGARRVSLPELVQSTLLQRHAPPAALIDRAGEVLQLHGATGEFVAQPAGLFTTNLLEMVAVELRDRLRRAMASAIQQQRSSTVSARTATARGDDLVRVTVSPFRRGTGEEELLLVTFERPSSGPVEQVHQLEPDTAAAVRELEDELRQTRAELQRTIDELETSNQEIRASHEEVVSMNEELQSTNEELETSREELQSVNEELTSLTAQLEANVGELERANDNLNNLLRSTSIATVFLDEALRIRLFTPACAPLFSLISTDVGRPLADIARRFADDALLEEARQVLVDLAPRQRQVQAEGGRWFVRRILPYRTQEDRVRGVVLTFADVTELERARRDLERSERLVRLVTNSLPALVTYVGPDLVHRFCNAAYEQWLGIAPEAAVGRAVVEVVGEDSFERLEPLLHGALAGEPSSGEVALELPRGERRWVHVDCVPDRRRSGEVRGVVALLTDVTRRHEAEAAASRLAAIVEHSYDAVIGKSLEGTITSWNAAAERIYGYAAAEAVGRSIDLIVPPERASELPAIYERLRAGEVVPPYETERAHRDGQRLVIEQTVSPIRDAAGALVGVSVVSRDATERRRTERALVRAQERLRLALEASALGTFELLPSGSIEAADPRCAEVVCGDAGADLVGRRWLDGVPTAEHERVTQAMGAAFDPEGEGRLALEHRVLWVDGRERWVAARGRVSRNQAEPRLVGTVQDVTARREADVALRQANERLEQGVRQRTQSLALHRERLRAMAYELSLSQQRQRRQLGDELHDRLTQLLAATLIKLQQVGDPTVGEVTDLLQQALDYTRELVADLSPTFLYDEGLASGVRWLAGQLRARHGLEVDLVAPAQLPSLAEDATILLFQMIRELLLNVAKHARTRRATVELAVQGGQLEVRVDDTGGGFDATRLEELSPPVHFGLFGVRERALALHGTFELRSEPGAGTTATVRVPLPAELAPDASDEARGALGLRREPGVGPGGIRVALVDDHDLVREGLRLTLEAQAEGEIVVIGEATNGEEAIELVEQLEPDVVLMDINMPILNGIEATRAIRLAHPTVRVIGVTVHTEKPRLDAMLEAGAAAVVTKGGSAAELVAAIRGAVT